MFFVSLLICYELQTPSPISSNLNLFLLLTFLLLLGRLETWFVDEYNVLVRPTVPSKTDRSAAVAA